MDEEHR